MLIDNSLRQSSMPRMSDKHRKREGERQREREGEQGRRRWSELRGELT
jgi:hypothetical protein